MPKVGGDAPPAFEDPIHIIRVLAQNLVPWNWRWFLRKSKASFAPKRKVLNVRVTEVDGAKSWSWDIEVPLPQNKLQGQH